MKYTKPEISHLGDAASVIQLTQVKGSGTTDVRNPLMPISPAYDLDE